MIHGSTSGFCPIFLPRCRQSGNSISRAQDSSTGDGERKTLHFISTSDQNETLGFPFPPFPVPRRHCTISRPLQVDFKCPPNHLVPSRPFVTVLTPLFGHPVPLAREPPRKGPSHRISCGDLSLHGSIHSYTRSYMCGLRRMAPDLAMA